MRKRRPTRRALLQLYTKSGRHAATPRETPQMPLAAIGMHERNEIMHDRMLSPDGALDDAAMVSHCHAAESFAGIVGYANTPAIRTAARPDWRGMALFVGKTAALVMAINTLAKTITK